MSTFFEFQPTRIHGDGVNYSLNGLQMHHVNISAQIRCAGPRKVSEVLSVLLQAGGFHEVLVA